MARPSGSARPRFAWLSFPAWFLELYRQPLAFLITAIGIPLLGLCVWLYAENERGWRAREGEDLLVAARLASRIIREELDQTRQIEDALGSRPAFIDAVKRGDRGALETSLQLLLDVTPMIDRVMVLDLEGRPLAAVAAAADASSATAEPPRPHAGRGQPVSGVYLRDAASGEKVVAVSSPVYEGNAALGLLQVQYRLQDISRWLDKVRVEPGGFVYVVDQAGFLVSYPFQLVPGQPKSVSTWPPVKRPLTPQGEVMRFWQGRPAGPWTAAVAAVEPFGWRVIAQQADAVMLRPFYRIVLSFLALIGLLAGILAFFLLRWAGLHQATLRLLAQQAKLLAQSERRHVAARLRKTPPKNS
ncbi:MAG: cache domain-containing protein [Candidatus Omnitrophica bacterium]|nr:cache domain-containing protein [Candidatus Omnitrophota bacterium]